MSDKGWLKEVLSEAKKEADKLPNWLKREDTTAPSSGRAERDGSDEAQRQPHSEKTGED